MWLLDNLDCGMQEEGYKSTLQGVCSFHSAQNAYRLKIERIRLRQALKDAGFLLQVWVYSAKAEPRFP